jgi:hypothetical protein
MKTPALRAIGARERRHIGIGGDRDETVGFDFRVNRSGWKASWCAASDVEAGR